MRLSHPIQGSTRPQVAGIIERPRLLQRLQGAVDHKLTLVTAPPGFGKTTLVAQLVRVVQQPVVWQVMDERSRDLPNLFRQTINTLSALLPEIAQLALPYGTVPGEMAMVVAEYLAEHLTDDTVYVLDDVHQLAGAASAEAWLRSLVTAIPPTCHLIIVSRTLPRLPLVEMIARGDVLAIGLDELRFTPDEIAEVGTAYLGARPADEQVQELLARLEGWPAGTVLAFNPLPTELEHMAFDREGGPEALFEALARITFQAQPLNIRNFLLVSSTLTQLTPEVCQTVCGVTNGSQMLAEIQTRNLFVSRVPGALVYHTLFRGFLQNELKSAEPEQYADLHSRAAGWFEANDQPDEAFDHYLEADQAPVAAALAERLAAAYFAQNRVETLLAWDNLLRQHGVPAPQLVFRCATIYMDRYDYAAAEDRLHETEATRRPDENETSFALIHIKYGQINVQRGNYEAAVENVSSLIDAEPESTNVRGRALSILGYVAYEMGRTEEAIQYLELALPLYRTYADSYSQSSFLQSLAAAYWRIGRLTDALAAFHEIVATQRALGGVSSLALALTNLGYAYHHLGNYPHAVEALQAGLGSIARFPNRRAQGYLLFNLADVHRDQGEMEDALSEYDQALSVVGDSEPTLTCTILCSISTLHRWQNRLPEALEAAQTADRLARKHRIGNEGRTARLALWAACIPGDDPETVLQQLDEIAADLEKQQERFDLLPTLGLCAYAALVAERPDSAGQYLDKAQKLGQAIGTAVPLAIELLHCPPLESFILQKPHKYASLLAALEQVRAAQTRLQGSIDDDQPMPQVIYNLRITTFGQAGIVCDSRTIPNNAWRPAARDLFLYLLFTKQATRDQICLEFWPDSSEKHARDNFHTTMHRIRDVLGDNIITLQPEEGMYRISSDIRIWCDAYELEAMADQARLLPVADARTEDLWRRAVGLYKGDFLPWLDAGWASDYRERLREAYLDALIGLGRCAQARGDSREAIQNYKRAVDIEPYREDIHQAIITCYVAQGARHKALAQLNQLKKLLREDLGVGLSRETLQLVKSLLV